MLAGPEVVQAMVDSWRRSASEPSIARRLASALSSGQDAGGDPRGKQSAAVFVVSNGAGYGGNSDVLVDLRCDDHPEPIAELERMLGLHELYFGSTDPALLLPLNNTLSIEIASLLQRVMKPTGDIANDLWAWMSRENYEERWHDGRLDPIVLEQLRKQAG